MRKIILNIAASLDGYIAGPRGEVDWIFRDFSEIKKNIDLILMGRKTFDALEGPWPYGKVLGHVFSRKLQEKSHENVVWVSEDLKRHILDLKKSEGLDIWLLGGGEIIREALKHHLIDEMTISIHPVLLGKGIPLFPPGFENSTVHLKKAESFPSGLVRLYYTLSTL